MLVAFSFTACSEDIMAENGGEKSTAQTIFSLADDDGTRTSINRKANFFWEVGDKIWVDGGLGYKQSSQSNITTAKQPSAKFVVDSTFTTEPLKVIYTGYANGDTTQTYYNKVTIADQQTQQAWNDGSHLGTSGDCATGLAYKMSGGYKFTLDHKASYLIFYPYLYSSMGGSNYTLQKIEIIADGQYVAGQFDFTFANGLADTPIAGQGKQGVTLTCGDNFLLSTDIPDLTASTTYNHCYVVIAPGTHELTIKYHVKNSSGTSYAFVKDLAPTKFDANGVYPYIHVLKDAILAPSYRFYETTLYQWGASTHYYGSNPAYNTSETELTNGFWATQPTRTDLYDYCANGNLSYWDNATEWTWVRVNGTEEVRRGGVWVRKKAYRTTPYTSSSQNQPILGRPDTLSDYFFLPALNLNGVTRYWSRTANSAVTAYCFMISKASVGVTGDYQKHNGGFAYNRGDGTPWFQ